MTIQSFDFAVVDWIQTHLRCGFLDFVMPKLTLFAEGGICLILIGVLLLFFRSRRVCGAALLTGLAGGFLVGNILLKNVIARPRPCWINTAVELLIDIPSDYSCPSGHTLHCFIAATVLLRFDKRLGWPVLVLAILVAFSRMYLYVHFLTDILAGAALGVGIGLLVSRLFERAQLRVKARRAA